MTTADLLALADRVEKLTGPDRKIDADIFQAIGGKPWKQAYNDATLPCGCPHETAVADARRRSPAYSASLDAAMTLVPRPMCWNGGEVNEDDYPWACITDGEGNDYVATGATPALAITAACLRARASTDKGEA